VFTLNYSGMNSFKKNSICENYLRIRKDEEYIYILWGMLAASGWWIYGLLRYYDMLGDKTPAWFGFAFIPIFLGSIVTAVYLIDAFVHIVIKCWDD